MRIFWRFFGGWLFALAGLTGCGDSPTHFAQLADANRQTAVIIGARRGGDFLFSIHGSELFDQSATGKTPREWRGKIIAAASVNFNADTSSNDYGGAPLILLLADGAAFSWRPGDADLTELMPAQSALHFRAAALVDRAFYAIADDVAAVPALYRWRVSANETDETSVSQWEKLAIPLPFWREPAIFTLTGCGEKLVLAWRPGNRIDGKTFSGWQAAEYDFINERWDYLPPPPIVGDGFFTVAALSGNDGVALAQESHRRIHLTIYDRAKNRWTTTALAAFPDRVFASPTIGLNLLITGDGMTLARSSLRGVDFIRAPAFPDDPGRVAATPYADAEKSSGNQYLRGFAWIVFALIAMSILLRRWARRAVGETASPTSASPADLFRIIKISGIASIFDRALAMMIDGAICMLAPLAYVMTLADLSAAARPTTFFLWLGAMAVYSAVAEFFWQRTPGKALLKMRVCDINGGAPTAKQILLRNLLRFIDFFPLSFGGFNVWYLIAAFSVYLTKQSQRVGDLAAGTVVRYHQPVRRRQVILASQSPQRRELLRRYGLNFTVAPAMIDETLPPRAQPAESAIRLAREKAAAIAAQSENAAVIIAADTLVVWENQILGKPADIDEARRMLAALANGKHHVFTGITVIDKALGVEISEVAITEIHWEPLDAATIEKYLLTDEWRGRAGGYAIQGAAGNFVAALYGSYSNVVGLPLELLDEMLTDLDEGIGDSPDDRRDDHAA